MARTIKDLFCRYKTQQGLRFTAGEVGYTWTTVELGVEELGITKEAIGKTITVEEYNRECREA